MAYQIKPDFIEEIDRQEQEARLPIFPYKTSWHISPVEAVVYLFGTLSFVLIILNYLKVL